MALQIIDIGAAPDDNTGDPLRDALDKVNDNFTELYQGKPPRGALVKKSAALTGQNVTAAFTAVTWNTDVYDTDAIHDTGSNTSRLSVPSGWSWVRLTARFRAENLSAPNFLAVAVYKNGATFTGSPQHVQSNDTLPTHDIMLVSAPLQVTGGTDYFELFWQVGVDTSVDIGADSWFAIELLA